MPPVQNEFPQPANARPPAPPADQPVASPVGSHSTIVSALRSFAGQETFTLDPDVRLALEDLCQAAEGRNWKTRWPTWLNEMINESIRGYLGR